MLTLFVSVPVELEPRGLVKLGWSRLIKHCIVQCCTLKKKTFSCTTMSNLNGASSPEHFGWLLTNLQILMCLIKGWAEGEPEYANLQLNGKGRLGITELKYTSNLLRSME